MTAGEKEEDMTSVLRIWAFIPWRPDDEAPPAHILMNLEKPQLLRMQQVLRQDSNFQDEEGDQTDEEAETYSDEVREELQEGSCGLL